MKKIAVLALLFSGVVLAQSADPTIEWTRRNNCDYQVQPGMQQDCTKDTVTVVVTVNTLNVTHLSVALDYSEPDGNMKTLRYFGGLIPLFYKNVLLFEIPQTSRLRGIAAYTFAWRGRTFVVEPESNHY